jgi:hypothetical protein
MGIFVFGITNKLITDNLTSILIYLFNQKDKFTLRLHIKLQVTLTGYKLDKSFGLYKMLLELFINSILKKTKDRQFKRLIQEDLLIWHYHL